MRPESFSFNFKGKNSKDVFGLVATSYDFLLPEKRERKKFIPFRHGQYDYGAHWYNERILRVRCIWLNIPSQHKTRSEIREISYWLSGKGKIEFPVEDKYYIGELYDSNELIMNYNYATEDLSTTDGEFELNFVCEPFAYRNIDTVQISGGINQIRYDGTAETETLLVLRNNSSVPISNIQVVLTRRKA